jgi:hypothetical protein
MKQRFRWLSLTPTPIAGFSVRIRVQACCRGGRVRGSELWTTTFAFVSYGPPLWCGLSRGGTYRQETFKFSKQRLNVGCQVSIFTQKVVFFSRESRCNRQLAAFLLSAWEAILTGTWQRWTKRERFLHTIRLLSVPLCSLEAMGKSTLAGG